MFDLSTALQQDYVREISLMNIECMFFKFIFLICLYNFVPHKCIFFFYFFFTFSGRPYINCYVHTFNQDSINVPVYYRKRIQNPMYVNVFDL